MTRRLLTIGLLASSTLVQAGQFTLSPHTVATSKGQAAAEIHVSYLPAAGVHDAQVDLRLNLDPLGWVQAQTIASTTPDFETLCAVRAGEVTALVVSRNLGALPVGTPIPLCVLRVRPQGHVIRGIHSISPANAYAYTDAGPVPATANPVRVVVQ